MMTWIRTSQAAALLIASVMTCVSASAASPEEILRDWTKAWRTSKVAAMTAFYEDSKDVVAWESSGKIRQGAAGIRQMYEDAFEEVVFDSAVLEELKVRQEGDIAWAHGRFKADTTVRADKSRWVLHVRLIRSQARRRHLEDRVRALFAAGRHPARTASLRPHRAAVESIG
jgi:ketosteroid isomerase-like protein